MKSYFVIMINDSPHSVVPQDWSTEKIQSYCEKLEKKMNADVRKISSNVRHIYVHARHVPESKE
jgi:hypothetical protein